MSASSYSWLGLSPMVWSLVSVVSSFVGLWVAGWAARRQVCGRVRLVMCLLAGLLQFILVLCGLSVLVVHMSPQAQEVAGSNPVRGTTPGPPSPPAGGACSCTLRYRSPGRSRSGTASKTDPQIRVPEALFS